ncbi:MAG: outer membrane beta-barrel protein [Elusimicrobiaceae bacterium]|nr:outer membrane beta-barrel protein [Elusimicrobiaceae bacterium]
MKKWTLFLLGCVCAYTVSAETLKMKDGTLISGSILSQTQYTLNLATSYGNITLNQREIEQILPDKHRLILKGGTQLVGVILDMDEFNLKLQTDEGAVVNVDMPQIVTIEAYDYDRGETAQQEFVEKKIEQQEQAQQDAEQAAQRSETAAGGLTFDSDIDQVFGARKATVVNGQVQTPSAQVKTAPAKPLSDEEAFLKNVKSGAISQQDYAQAAKQELAATRSSPKKEPTQPVKRIEKNFSKYLAIQVGAMPLDLQISGPISIGSNTVDLAENKLDAGGTSIAVSGKFLWRVKESNLWLGPTLAFANIANNDFSVQDGINTYDIHASGSLLSLGAAANYYLNPTSRWSCYLTASAQYEMLSLNYHGDYNTSSGLVNFSNSISSNGPSGAVGIGIETWVDDLMVGLEVRQVFAPRKDELKKSAASNTVVQAQLSWKF